MQPASWPWEFGSGTGVLGRIGPVRLPFATICYHLVRGIVPESQLHCMPWGGVGHLEGTYRHTERRLLAIAGTGKVNLVGHSQMAPHYLRFAALHPDKVGIVVSLAGPLHGSRLAEHRGFTLFPCAHDMRPESAYLAQVRTEFAAMLVARRRRPRVICFAVYRDRIVWPWHSSLIEGAENYVLSSVEPDRLPHEAVWLPTNRQHNHFDVITSDETIAAIGTVLHGTRRRSRPVDTPVVPLAA